MSNKHIEIVPPEFVELSAITPCNIFRCRPRNDEATVEAYTERFTEYKEATERGEKPDYPFPPVWVRQDGAVYTQVTGFLRVEAAKQAGLDTISARRFEGTEDEALLFAMRDNRTHGLRLSYCDLKYCIDKTLNRFHDLTAGAIAKILGCSRSYVYKIKKELSASGCLPDVRQRRGANGKTYRVKQRVEQSDIVVDQVSTSGHLTGLGGSGGTVVYSKHGCDLYLGDCFEIMPKLGVIADATITDTPYNCMDNDWDWGIPLDKFWEIVRTKTKQAANIILFGCGGFTIDLANSNRKWFRYKYAWLKSNLGNWQNAARQPLRAYEDVLVFGRPGFMKAATFNPIKTPSQKSPAKMINPCDVVSFDIDNDQQGIERHPTQKPLALMEHLVKTYTNEGDLVIDMFMGSGTTACACVKLNRRFIGIEQKQEYVDMAVERLNRITIPTLTRSSVDMADVSKCKTLLQTGGVMRKAR